MSSPSMAKLTSLLILFLAISFPAAPSTRADALSCSVKITVRGDARSFWTWGTDTWTGEGQIECHKKAWTRWSERNEMITAPVFAHYESWGPGDGATGDSEVVLSLDGLELSDINDIYGSYRTLGGAAKLSRVGGQFLLLTQSPANHFIWSLTPRGRAVNTGAFLHFGQLILRPSKPKED